MIIDIVGPRTYADPGTDDGDQLAFTLHPVPTSTDVPLFFDWIVRRIAPRLTNEARDAWMQSSTYSRRSRPEEAVTWRSPQDGKPTVRGIERLCASQAELWVDDTS